MHKRFFYIVIALIIIAIDQLTKIWIKSSLYFGDRINIVPGFLNLTYVENSGGAFGIFGSLSSPYRTIIFSLFSLAAIALILYYLIKLSLESRFMLWGFGLILSGAIGNFIDRIRLRYVIDFIDLHIKGYHWPTFNIADIAICVGLAIIAISYIINLSKGMKE